MSEEWKKDFFEWKDEIEGKFNDLSQKHSELKELLEANAELAEGNNTAIHNLVDGYIMFKDVLLDMLENKKQNAEKHLAELVDDPQIDVEFIKACEKQIEDTKRQLGKLDSTKKKFPSDSQEFWDNLDKNLEKQKASGGAIKFSEDPLGIWVKGKFYPDSDKFPEVEKLPEFLCTLKEQDECDEECSMECLKGNSEGDRFENGSCVHGKKELEKHPEPICPFCGRNLILYNQKWICGHGCTKLAIKSKESEPEKEFEVIETIQAMINHEHMLVKQHKKEIQKLIEDAIKDLDELIAWSNNYPKDSEIYIRLKRKREKWQGKQK